jgi:hypothetical protein
VRVLLTVAARRQFHTTPPRGVGGTIGAARIGRALARASSGRIVSLATRTSS